MRYHRVRLHDIDDPQYRAYISALMATKANHKAIRPATHRSLFGSEAEDVVRGWLTQFHPLSDNRYVEYDERTGTQLIRKYRELDAVQYPDATHIHVYEVKASGQLRSITRGLRQLNETRTILKRIIPHVACTLILVDTGIITAAEVAALMATADAPINPPGTLADYQRDHPEVPFYAHDQYHPRLDEATAVVTMAIADIVHLAGAGADALHLDWSDELDDPRDDDEEPPITPGYTSHDADEGAQDDSPFAAALRKAAERAPRS
jgi:hypothetical protein